MLLTLEKKTKLVNLEPNAEFDEPLEVKLDLEQMESY